MSKYDDLVRKLKEIFQIDRPELDFGVYRILNARVGEINDYLENRLKAKVTESLSASGASNLDSLRRELKEKEEQYRGDGIDPDNVPKIKELRQKVADLGSGGAEHENAVFTHLLTFFSRYYDNGDFISQRRYKGDTYAIPYGGEEVVLHWANKDQHYTKSGENFSNYGFKLEDGRTVRFRLVSADTAKDNRKDNDKERRFVLIDPLTRSYVDDEGNDCTDSLMPIEESDGELVVRFEYKTMPKGTKQDALVKDAVEKILENQIVKAKWLDLSKREPTESNPQRTFLEKCLSSYTAKNLADYFIHKDLGGFLKRELDFYIKNEVMFLDDVQAAEKFSDIEKSLRIIQTLRSISLDLISFLSHLENFQQKLWLKKKFIISSHYCITLDRIPERLYEDIAANQKQWAQWKKLGLLEDNTNADLFQQAKVGTVGYLKEHQYLMADTELFNAEIKWKLLSTFDELDQSVNGIIIYGDNFHALNLLIESYREQVKCIYIDPPYNTGGDGFAYKDKYQHGSWASMMDTRLSLSKNYLNDHGVIFCSIDDKERSLLEHLMIQCFGRENRVEELIWVQNSTKNQSPTYSTNHEYIEVFSRNLNLVKADKATFREPKPGLIEMTELSDAMNSSYPTSSEVEAAIGRLFDKHRAEFRDELESLGIEFDKNLDSWKGLYNYNRAEYRDSEGRYVSDEDAKDASAKIWIWRESDTSMPQVKEDSQKAEFRDANHPMYRFYRPLHPTTNKPSTAPKRGWAWPLLPQPSQTFSFDQYSRDNRIVWGKDEKKIPQIKRFLHETETNVAKSTINDFSDGEKQLTDLFGKTRIFGGPKPTTLIERFIQQTTSATDLVMDFFAGSGTTGHAVLNVNRVNHSNLRYMLVEQAEHAENIIKPRLQKVVFSKAWKDGKPTAPQTGISHVLKVLKLESYEDTLNNLQLSRDQAQQSFLESLSDEVKEDYLLRYMLDIESRGSLLSVEQFNKPFDCKLKVTVDSAGAYQERNIDLVETFNYLIGLRVKHIDMQLGLGFVSLTGSLPSGDKALVLWRDVEKVDYESLNRLCEKLAINPADSEFDVVYINGDHNIPAVFTSTQAEGGITKTLKIRQIEPEFMSRMFSTGS